LTFLFYGDAIYSANLLAQETNDLSVEIVTLKDKQDRDCLPFGAPFNVIFSNHSKHTLHIWTENCEPGYQNLTFRAKEAEDNIALIHKSPIEADYWTNYPPEAIEIPPGKSYTREVNFEWMEWLNLPEPNTGENVEFSAVFEIKPTKESKNQEVWNGHIESTPRKVLILNPMLKTPQDYLWNKCPQQALKLMKADLSLINSEDDHDQCTPLHHAARSGYTNVVIWLVQHGADVNAKAYNDFTPLDLTDQKEIAKILINAGANLNQKSGIGKTPLQYAAQERRTNVVDAILESGYKMDLYSAILLKRRDEAIKMLIHDPSAIVGGLGGWSLNGSDTPLGEAARQGDVELAQLLLAAGAPIDDPTEVAGAGYATPLCNAVWAEKTDMVEFLINNGASTSAVGGKFFPSIAEYTEKYSNKKIAELLRASTNNPGLGHWQEIRPIKNKLPKRIASGEFKLPASLKDK